MAQGLHFNFMNEWTTNRDWFGYNRNANQQMIIGIPPELSTMWEELQAQRNSGEYVPHFYSETTLYRAVFLHEAGLNLRCERPLSTFLDQQDALNWIRNGAEEEGIPVLLKIKLLQDPDPHGNRVPLVDAFDLFIEPGPNTAWRQGEVAIWPAYLNVKFHKQEYDETVGNIHVLSCDGEGNGLNRGEYGRHAMWYDLTQG